MIYSDLHCHPSLKPTYNKGYNNDNGDIWKDRSIERSCLTNKIAGTQAVAFSQSNLNKCATGNVRLLFTTAYALERSFFHLRTFPALLKPLLSALFLQPINFKRMLSEVVGIPIKVAKRFSNEYNDGVNYYRDYLNEIDLLISNQNNEDSALPGFKFQLAKDYSDLKRLLDDEKTIAGILNIEGAHTLGQYDFKKPFSKATLEDIQKKGFEEDSRIQHLTEQFQQNIKAVKSQADGARIPFYITFCHHFNNLLAGHAPSLSTLGKIISQEAFMEHGFSPLGRKVIKQLLSKQDGRRILIDVKHMSVKTRIEFYNILKNEYANDNIPIINSHASINGIKTLAEASHIDQKKSNKLTKKSFFGKGTICLTDEDIKQTFNSHGLIGVCLLESRMPGKLFKKEKKKIIKKYKNHDEKVKQLFMKLLWSNIIHIVKIQTNELSNTGNPHRSNDAWSGITIGSDYDGIVDAFDNVETAESYSNLRDDMINYMSNPIENEVQVLDVYTEKPILYTEVKALIELDGKTIKGRVDQMMFNNLMDFLKIYFNEEYLTSTNLKSKLNNHKLVQPEILP